VNLKDKKNKLTVPLIIITFALWGLIIYKVINYLNSPGEDKSEMVIDKNETASLPLRNNLQQEEALANSTIERDPFVFRKKQPVKPINEIVPIQVKKVIPPKLLLNYVVNGIIINQKSKLVLFEDRTNNKTVFLREGEQYLSVRIKKIFTDKVVLIEDSIKKEIVVK
jgi:hypothetical protein